MRPVYKKIAVVLVFFVFTGLLKSSWESSLDRRLTEARLLREPPIQVDWRQRLRQEVLGALFGKLRSIMAIYWTLAGMEDWSNKDWPGVQKNFRMATDLDPDDVDLWSFYIWQLETNAASYWIMREDLPESVREAEADLWILNGLDVANRALQYHPESSKLLAQSAKVYLDKLEVPCIAADYYRRARDGDAPLGFLVRFYPYALALCSGSEQEAYQMLTELYSDGKRHRVPTLIKRIKALEETLNIPASQRIPERDPDIELLERFPHATAVLDKIDATKERSDQEAYDTLKSLYDRGQEHRVPILIERLNTLEKSLNLPPEQQIPDPAPSG